MKLPDLAVFDDAGVRDWSGDLDTVKAAAAAAKLGLSFGRRRATPTARARFWRRWRKGLKLPEHFGNNWDALADCLEDGDWLGSHGMVIAIRHAAQLPQGARGRLGNALSDILNEAAEYWRERHKPFWVFVH